MEEGGGNIICVCVYTKRVCVSRTEGVHGVGIYTLIASRTNEGVRASGNPLVAECV